MKTREELLAAVEAMSWLEAEDIRYATPYHYQMVCDRIAELRAQASQAEQEPVASNYTANKETAPTSVEFSDGRKVWIVDGYLEVGWTMPRLQACRPEDREMLATPAGKELVELAIGAMTEAHPAPAPADPGMLKAAFYDGYTEREEELRRDSPADMVDPYVGAREDLEDWKRRALAAERDCRYLTQELQKEVSGHTFMGEPVLTKPAEHTAADAPSSNAGNLQALKAAKEPSAVGVPDVAGLWCKARCAWDKVNRHGTLEQADAAAISVITTALAALQAQLADAKAMANHYEDAFDRRGAQNAQQAVQIRELEAERDALKADAERVDWLKKLFSHHWDGTIGRPRSWSIVGHWRHVVHLMRGHSFREAVDAAREKP